MREAIRKTPDVLLKIMLMAAPLALTFMAGISFNVDKVHLSKDDVCRVAGDNLTAQDIAYYAAESKVYSYGKPKGRIKVVIFCGEE